MDLILFNYRILQYDRAKAIVIKIADSRSHSYDRMTLKTFIWKLGFMEIYISV